MGVPGLTYIDNYVTEAEESFLLSAVDGEPWRGDLKRRVQHYGYRYDYTFRTVDPSMYLGPLPSWAQSLADRLVADGQMEKTPDQVIVNEYEPGQGINPHIDCVPCFGPVVCSLTLGSQCLMDLSKLDITEQVSVLLERTSLLVLSGDARYKWRHGIQPRNTDMINGQVLVRGRRVSLTFRTVIIS